MAATSIAEFDSCIPDLFDASLVECLTLQQKAALRVAWKRCFDIAAAECSPISTKPEVAISSAVPASASSWSETFAPKLTSQIVADMKSTFKRGSPSEIVTQRKNCPSLRLLSQIHHQKSKGERSWISWKYRLSASKADELQSQKSSRILKDESLSLHSLLYEDPPSSEVSKKSMGITQFVACSRHGHLEWQ